MRAARPNVSVRTACYPAALTGTQAWAIPVDAAGGVDALRERYPLVTALLIEIAERAQRNNVPSPTQLRG